MGFRCEYFTIDGEEFELTRYDSNTGRVYHVRSAYIVIENAHLARGAHHITDDVRAWMLDPEHKTIQYSAQEVTA